MAILLNLAVIFGGQIALSVARMVLSLYALDLGASAAQAGLLVAILPVCQLLFAIAAGMAADRHGARWMMLGGSLLGAVGFGIAALAGELWALHVAAVCMGIWFALILVPVQSLIGTLSTPQNLTRNFANYALCFSVGNMIAPLAAGAVIDGYGHAAGCWTVSGIGLLLGAMILAFGRCLPGGRSPEAGVQPLVSVLSSRVLWRAIAQSAALEMALEMFPFLITLHGHGLGFTGTQIGTALGAAAVIAFLLRLALPQLSAAIGEVRLLRASLLAAATGLALAPLLITPVTLLFATALFGLGIGCAYPLLTMLVFRNAPRSSSGSVIGVRATGASLLRLIGPGLGGAAAALAGLAPVFLAVALVVGASALLLDTRQRPSLPN